MHTRVDSGGGASLEMVQRTPTEKRRQLETRVPLSSQVILDFLIALAGIGILLAILGIPYMRPWYLIPAVLIALNMHWDDIVDAVFDMLENKVK
jgi:hypothetical protein